MPGENAYEEKKKRRVQRYLNLAEKNHEEAEATLGEARRMADVIPLGQPVLIGHHSEQRDRNYRKRLQNKFRKSSQLTSKAKHYERRAEAAENNTAVSSDDPEAENKLEGKLKEHEARQAWMKRLNAAWRKAGKPAPDDIEAWERIATALGLTLEALGNVRVDMAKRSGWHPDQAPYPSYALQNNNAEIRRLKKRIKEQDEASNAESSEVDHGVVVVVEDVIENRVQLFFDGKPPGHVRAIVKRRGFRWARSVGAWQRQLNENGRFAAKWVVDELKALEEKP